MDQNPDYASIPLLLSEAPAAGPHEQLESNEDVSAEGPSPLPAWWDGAGTEIARATRSWIQYGTLAFAVLCIVIGAVEALFGR